MSREKTSPFPLVRGMLFGLHPARSRLLRRCRLARDGRFWERFYPDSEMQGGGPEPLRSIDSAEAAHKYGVTLGASMNRDIDFIIEQVIASIPGILIKQLKVAHPGADDDGLWFINIPDRENQVQIESSEGSCPFLIESDSTTSVSTATRFKRWL
jgi:hypothetical protein